MPIKTMIELHNVGQDRFFGWVTWPESSRPGLGGQYKVRTKNFATEAEARKAAEEIAVVDVH